MNIKAIWFDYWGVIYGNPWIVFSKNVAKILEISLEEYFDIYFKNNYLLTKHILCEKDFWLKILKEINKINKEKDLWIFLENEKKEINKELLEIIKSLKSNWYKIWILTNNNEDWIKLIKKQKLYDIFDVIISSHEIGFMKPEKEAFEIFSEKMWVQLNELLFVDDTQKSLENAREIWFIPMLFTDVKTLKNNFKNFEINF